MMGTNETMQRGHTAVMNKTSDYEETPAPHVAAIVAMDRNRVIGCNNAIPWRLPAEQQYFRRMTMGHTVLSGRINFEAMKRPLPGRNNVILTRDPEYAATGCAVVRSVDEALAKYATNSESPLFVIGGEQIYRLFLPYTNTLYLTVIDAQFKGDTFFPELDMAEWIEQSREQGVTDELNRHSYTYFVYRRTPLKL